MMKKAVAVAALAVLVSCAPEPVVSPRPISTAAPQRIIVSTPTPTLEVTPTPTSTVTPTPIITATPRPTEKVNIALSEKLQKHTLKLCKEYDIEEHFDLIIAVMWTESNFKASLISSTNDYGLMQINKVNHKWLSKELGITDFLDAKQNIHAGIYMLSSYLHKYDSINKALMAYNMGEAGARRLWKKEIYSTKYTKAVRKKMNI